MTVSKDGSFTIFVINPGSTSTKFALFRDGQELFSHTQRYDVEVLREFVSMADQETFRRTEILKVLNAEKINLADVDAVVGRGGLLRPIEGGTYVVNAPMLEDLVSCRYGTHASNLGAPLALALAQEAGGKPAFIVDPVVVDELLSQARLSGFPGIERRSIFHALNQKAVARRFAAETGRRYEELNLVVAHMGGGISVGAHLHGRVADVNNALDGEGPFSPERAGSLPAGELVKFCFSGAVDLETMLRKLVGGGGMVAHLGTNDLREAYRRACEGDASAELVLDAMTYQVAKEIGSRAVTLRGEVDAILLTGGLAYAEDFVERIRRRVQWIAPVKVYEGEDELRALAEGALRVLQGLETAKIYGG